MIKENLQGQKFGRLSVLRESGEKISERTTWICKCECGKIITTISKRLKNGQTKSCGCYSVEQRAKNKTKHGLSKSRIYKIYRGIITRCYNKNRNSSKYYYEKNISVCEKWRGEGGFINFYLWSINNGYSDDFSIERKDIDKDYSPENCCWIPFGEQALNKSTSLIVTYKGKTANLSEFVNIAKVSERQLYKRIKDGWNINDAIEIPPLKNQFDERRYANV